MIDVGGSLFLFLLEEVVLGDSGVTILWANEIGGMKLEP